MHHKMGFDCLCLYVCVCVSVSRLAVSVLLFRYNIIICWLPFSCECAFIDFICILLYCCSQQNLCAITTTDHTGESHTYWTELRTQNVSTWQIRWIHSPGVFHFTILELTAINQFIDIQVMEFCLFYKVIEVQC